ncbi:MAG: 2-phospho-L-lactate guanylyltransferase [Actinomycetota bacterium]
MLQAAVVVPIKSFRLAKDRLAEVLTPAERADLARSCAGRVLDAARGFDTIVVCDDDEVAAWAEHRGARAVRPDAPGLNAAVRRGVDAARDAGHRVAMVVHADLPLARDLAAVLRGRAIADALASVTIVPDRHGDGTNVLVVPAAMEYDFHYGRGSAEAHASEARARGLAVHVVHDPELEVDLDVVDDLAEARRRTGARDAATRAE